MESKSDLVILKGAWQSLNPMRLLRRSFHSLLAMTKENRKFIKYNTNLQMYPNATNLRINQISNLKNENKISKMV